MCIIRLSLLLVLLGIYLPPAFAEKPTAPNQIAGVHTLSAEQVVEHLRSNPSLVIIDARKEKVYAKGHIENAVSLLDSQMTPVSLTKYVRNKNTPVLFYCEGTHCMRSTHAVSKALKWGYHQLYWFRGGWSEWTVKRLPIEH